MKTAIYKYNILVGDETTFVRIKGFVKALSFVVQHNEVFMYTIVDLDNPVISRLNFSIRGTGWEMDDNIWNKDNYIFAGSFVLRDYVWHIWHDRNAIVRPEDNI